MPGVLRLSAAAAFRTVRRSAGAANRPHYNRCHSRALTTEAADAATEQIAELRRSFDRDVAAGCVVPVYKRALLYGDRPAIKDADVEYTYGQLYAGAKRLSIQLSNQCGEFASRLFVKFLIVIYNGLLLSICFVCTAGSGSSCKVAVLTANTSLFTVAQWACWFSGLVVVPLSPKQPAAQLSYFLSDSAAACIVSDAANEAALRPLAEKLGRPLIVIDPASIPGDLPTISSAAAEIALAPDNLEATQTNAFYTQAAAMILYTSGSTGPPKGTVLTHRMLHAQTESLRSAWHITGADTLLHVLPLNHVHGSVNALLLPLSVGAKVLTHNSRFDAPAVWSALLNVRAPARDRITLFMAVPTIYALLLAEYDRSFGANARMIDYVRSQCERSVRLMVSGSAPLAASVFRRWHEVTGHRLLERYGMTECGMALSQPLREDRVRRRREGRVGVPLPGVEVKLVRVHDGKTVAEAAGVAGRGWWSEHELPEYEQSKVSKANHGDGPNAADAEEPAIGELCVRGPGVFVEYLNRPSETGATFEADGGWFRTGDEARRHDDGTFQILGRRSVDIIKTGGYKVSALEVETVMLDHPSVRDVCVVGVPDVTWGQRVAAVVVQGTDVVEAPAERSQAQQQELLAFCREQLATYQVPVEFRWVTALPRNAMGKVNKRAVLAEMFGVVEPPKTPAAISVAETANETV